ncbi:hypothetical protein BGZ54_005684, partial [Gamsiella multidivaricata]
MDSSTEDLPSAASQPSQPAVVLEMPDTIQIKLHLRKGIPRVRCRSLKDLPDPEIFPHNWRQDPFEVLRARIRSRAKGLSGLEWPMDALPYIRPSNSSPQQHYQEVNKDNCDERIAKAWRTEAKRLGDLSKVYVHLFIYLVDANDTKKGITAGKRSSNAIQQTSGSTAVEAASSTGTVAAAVQRMAEATTQEEECATIRVKLNDQWVSLQVSVRSLREAL